MANSAEQLAETLKSFGVRAVYGDAIEIDGTTVVPVAVMAYGFGAGEGKGPDGEGSGGGGGGYTLPIGAYLGDALGVRFQPNLIALLTVATPFVWVAGKSLARLIRALKK